MNEKYVLEEVTCPECGGEGRIETMTMLTYSGSQSWSVKPCPRCWGSRSAMEPVPCASCGDPILLDELFVSDKRSYHKECWENEKE